MSNFPSVESQNLQKSHLHQLLVFWISTCMLYIERRPRQSCELSSPNNMGGSVGLCGRMLCSGEVVNTPFQDIVVKLYTDVVESSLNRT